MEKNKLYKIDLKGKTRVWWVEYNETSYRTHSGILNGAIVTSGWQYPTEKNIGKINETSVEEQVLSEVNSIYEIRKYQGKYHETIEAAKSGALFVECMLAEKFDSKKNKEFPYYSQPKLDGVRCLVGEDFMQTRNGKTFVSSPHILESLKDFFNEFPFVILDGELYNHELKNDFEKIISLARKTKPKPQDLIESRQMVQYHVYDVILNNDSSFSERIKFLKENIENKYEFIKVVDTCIVNNNEELDTKLGEYIEDGYEGQMLRINEYPYEHRRSRSLLKNKQFEDGEFEIVDIIEGKGNWSGYAKSIIIKLPDGTTQKSGMRGAFKKGKEILENKEKYIGTEVTVRYQNKTADNKLRFPVVTVFWKGKRDV